MKKIIKNPLFTFILGALIFSSLGVAAYSLLSSDVQFTPENNKWQVGNVEEALNSLYISKTTDNYSQDEQVVGTWIDGKPLYQKTITFTIPSNNSAVVVDTLPTEVETKKTFGGVIFGNGSYVEFNYADTGAATYCLTFIDERKITVVVHDSDLLNKSAFLTVQYTKTTDKAKTN